MRIIRLGPDDLALFRSMNGLFAAVFKDPHSYASAPPSDEHARKLLADANFIALVAEQDGHVTGALAAYVLPKFEQARSEIYIYDLAVDLGHRRRGIATGLIGWLREHARAINAWAIYVQADPPDAPAVALYEKLGTREEVFHFDIAPLGTKTS